MFNNNLIYITIVILVILVIIFFISKRTVNIENFHWDHLHKGPRSLDCYKLSKGDCMKYANCGLCLKDRKKLKLTCIPGDYNGPFFKEDCLGWIHMNTYDRHMFDGERIRRRVPPWSMFYPTYEARYPSPRAWSTLL
uniref:Uncharacterized protein n=1 Tax=Mimivirus LCMiAC02 TaxID=2506609 RepID=A0A4P6VQR3_9VIRU|nr:MAG: hypothetical protein LCMiAC02_05000 [Mimivirus LCMiAC02]